MDNFLRILQEKLFCIGDKVSKRKITIFDLLGNMVQDLRSKKL